MKKLIFAISLCLFISSCKESKQYVFDENGLSFICAKGWSVTDKEYYEDGTCYISLEKDGFDGSGLITLVVSGYHINEIENIEAYQNELRQTFIFKKSNIIFEPIRQDKFNNLECKSSEYTFKLLGLEHHGMIYSFFQNDYSVLVLKQEALEDMLDNQEGFSLFESSLKIN